MKILHYKLKTCLAIFLFSAISSGQGFIIEPAAKVTEFSGDLAMNNNVRTTDQTHPLITSASKGPKPLIRFTASFSDNLIFPDFAVVYFDNKATGEFDGQLDALKLLNTDIQVPNLYFITPSAVNLSIYALSPLLDNLYQIPLGLKINRQGSVIFKIRDIDSTFYKMKIYLTDLVAGTSQDILPGKEYKLYLPIGEYNTRFILNFSNMITDVPENIPSPDLFSIYYSQSVFHTKINKLQGTGGSLSICNLSGQTLYVMKVYDEGDHELYVALKDGVYLAVFVSGTTRLTKKIMINN